PVMWRRRCRGSTRASRMSNHDGGLDTLFELLYNSAVLIRVDPSREAPLYEQVAASVRAAATAGRMRPGDRLPSARELSAARDINLHTVLRGYQVLREEGLVTMRRGRGAILTETGAHLAQIHSDVKDLVDRARGLGLSADSLAAIVKETWNDH